VEKVSPVVSNATAGLFLSVGIFAVVGVLMPWSLGVLELLRVVPVLIVSVTGALWEALADLDATGGLWLMGGAPSMCAASFGMD
jgi:hypothetical protein